MKKQTRLTALLLFAAMLTGTLAGCGEKQPSDTATDSTADTTPEETTAAGYDYPDVDYEGYEFKILNIDSFYN